MIKASLVGGEELISKLENMPVSIRKQLRQSVEMLSIKLTGHIKGQKLSGQVLNVRTGRLRRSINYKVTETGSKIVGVVGTNVVYARVHEYGSPSKAKGFKERSFMRSSLRDLKEEITKELRLSARRAAEEAIKR